jgi:1,4-alpha-glucan branching enzyme
MLYLDYSRKEGEWVANRYGGRENLEAIEFLKQMNISVFQHHPGTVTVAEESTAWPGVSRPAHLGGLGFGMKWNMGWMHDMLTYMSEDPVHRKYHHSSLTFALLYAFHENFILPLSHDEVVHGKRSLLEKMPGDLWQKMANLRLLYGYMFGQPGKKLLFMGGEFGQRNEWDHQSSLDWHLLDDPGHAGIRSYVRDLNALYRREPAMWEKDFDAEGFQWIDLHNWEESVVAFMRRGNDPDDALVFVYNFTPVPRTGYRIGVPRGGAYAEVLNSDSEIYGGSNLGNLGRIESESLPWDGMSHSISITLPPLAALVFKPV